MTWPAQHLEHLAGAAALNGLALAWFLWGRGHAPGAARERTWIWLGAAALTGALRILGWIFLTAVQFEAWPPWVGPALAVSSAIGGLAAAVGAWLWCGRPLSRSQGWVALLVGATLAALFPALAPGLAGAGWLAAALALVFRADRGTSFGRTPAIGLGLAFGVLAATEFIAPTPAGLLLRLPSEQMPQWGSPELLSFGGRALAQLTAGLIFWLADRPRHRRWLALAAAVAAVLFGLSWREARGNAAARNRAWTELEEFAREVAPALGALRLDDSDLTRPEYADLVRRLLTREQTTAGPVHYWAWTVRDGGVVHMVDGGGLGGKPGVRRTPPGYRLTQLPNLAMRAARGERFESGSFFMGGQRYSGFHVPVSGAASAPPIGWLQWALPSAEYESRLTDPRGNAAIGLLFFAGIGALVLSGRSWLETSRRLHQQAVEAAATARAKNEMAGLVSHELRTPLQVVLGHLELLARAPLPAETRRSLSVIDGQCRQLLGLVNDTLDLCALEAGRLARRPVRFAPASLAESIVRDFRPLAAERGLALELEIAPGLPALVEADAARWRQILTNLLANALKYTPRGSVRLGCALESGAGGRLVFVVSDTGPGLPAPVLARLGEAFQPGPARQSTGLGLAMVHRLCGHLGGEFAVVNPPAGGCVATVRLPAALAVPDAAGLAGRGSADPGGVTLAGTRIVLAEDNVLVRELLASALRELGAEVEAFADGAAALAACRMQTPDAVLLDLAMPGVDGRTAARALREAAAAARVPRLIVGLSAEVLDETEARAAGFDRFFVKPVGLAELAAVFAVPPPGRASSLAPSERIRELFRHEAPAQLVALRAALARGDRTEIVRLAHYLQGSAYALADEPLRAACAALRAAGELTAEAGAGAVRRVEAEVDRLLRVSA